MYNNLKVIKNRKIWHVRKSKCSNSRAYSSEDFDHFGGATIVLIQYGEASHVGISICSKRDHFCKARGRDLATIAAIKAMEAKKQIGSKNAILDDYRQSMLEAAMSKIKLSDFDLTQLDSLIFERY